MTTPGRHIPPQRPALILLMLSTIFWDLGGCTSTEVDERSTAISGTSSTVGDSLGFGLEVTLCRKVGSKTGRRIGVGSEFRMEEKSRVQALVDITSVPSERDFTLHLVWIRPDGREMFRKYGEARQTQVAAENYRTVVRWLDGVDLHKVRADTLTGSAPEFTLDSRFNTSLAKQREPGVYQFRVYLDRRLLSETAFTLES